MPVSSAPKNLKQKSQKSSINSPISNSRELEIGEKKWERAIPKLF